MLRIILPRSVRRFIPLLLSEKTRQGNSLAEYFRKIGVDTSGIVRAKDWVTPTKTRFLAGWTHTVAQQVLRVDREPAGPPAEKILAKIAAKLQRAAALRRWNGDFRLWIRRGIAVGGKTSGSREEFSACECA